MTLSLNTIVRRKSTILEFYVAFNSYYFFPFTVTPFNPLLIYFLADTFINQTKSIETKKRKREMFGLCSGP